MQKDDSSFILERFFLDLFISKVIFLQHQNCKQVFNMIYTNLYHISLQQNLSSTQFTNLNSIELHLNSSCVQHHSIFSFNWNLIFTKSTHFPHQLIIASRAQQQRAQVNRHNTNTMYNTEHHILVSFERQIITTALAQRQLLIHTPNDKGIDHLLHVSYNHFMLVLSS